MSSKINKYCISKKFDRYKSIFEHYGFDSSSCETCDKNESCIETSDEQNSLRINKNILQKNENNKEKKILAKTKSPNKSKHKTKSSKKSKAEKDDKLTKLTVPDVAKKRKASPTSPTPSSSRTASPIPVIAVHDASLSTKKTAQNSPSTTSQIDQHSRNIQSSVSVFDLPTPSPNLRSPGASTLIVNKLSNDLQSLWDLDELQQFTNNMFKYSSGDIDAKPTDRSYRPRLNCGTDQDQSLEKYVQSLTHCLNVFDEYVATFTRQHGFIRGAAADPPTFNPAISITGPEIKKAPGTIDKEDSRIIKKLLAIEPRKKYALIHEEIGIFILGGYNLFVNIPVQKEPDTDYLFKFNGEVVKLSPLRPSRANFAIYTDGSYIYIAGGQTIENELLDDIQRLNIKTFKWEYITTLMNPIAASGMTVDNNRIYLAGGYDIVGSQTIFLSDYTIYDMSTGHFEEATELPSPRCRSLVFICDRSVFCISGLIETLNENNNKKLKISTDILKWSTNMPLWIKVSQTPELTKYHALSFSDPYLEITKRLFNDKGEESDAIMEAHYDFRSNTWANGRASKASPSTSHTPKSPSKARATSPPKKARHTSPPNKAKAISPPKKANNKEKSPTKTSSPSRSPSRTKSTQKIESKKTKKKSKHATKK